MPWAYSQTEERLYSKYAQCDYHDCDDDDDENYNDENDDDCDDDDDDDVVG